MADRGGRFIQKNGVRIALAHPQAQFGFLAAERVRIDPAQLDGEPANLRENLPAE